jgi:hypothetical protein
MPLITLAVVIPVGLVSIPIAIFFPMVVSLIGLAPAMFAIVPVAMATIKVLFTVISLVRVFGQVPL